MLATNALLDAALAYAELGWPVLPVHGVSEDGTCTCSKGKACPSPGKTPHIKGWPEEASTDPETIRSWWGKWPHANVGVLTGGRSGLVALDVDRRHGGMEALSALEEEYGPLPETLVAHTGGNGRHYLFQLPEERISSKDLCRGVEIKSNGSFIVAAPSRHESGGEYQWEDEADPSSSEIAPLPFWVLGLVVLPTHSTNGRRAPHVIEMPDIPPGARNDTLVSLAGTMQRRAMPAEAIRSALHAVNRLKCSPPLPADELERVLQSALLYRPDASSVPRASGLEIHNTDLGNARRLVEAHGADLRFVPPWKTWLVWEGNRWRRDEDGAVVRRAKKVVNGLYAEAGRDPDPEARKSRARFALKSESEPRLRAMVELAKSETGIPIQPGQLDANPSLLTVTNGTIDLRNGELLPPCRDHLITRLAPVRYDPKARSPRWESFLAKIFDGNEGLIRYLQRAVGYSLTGSTVEQVFFLLHGTGQNGKSSFLEAVRFILGEYARQTDFTTFLESKSDRIRNDLAGLVGARFVTAIESKQKSRLDESAIKQVTGGDTISARFLFREFFEFLPAFKVWLATNHRPDIRGTDDGIWRRVVLVPFNVAIPEAERDRSLGEKLQDEAGGILRWAVEGCLDWQKHGLGAPPEVTSATGAYREDSDPLGGFLRECCVFGSSQRVGATDLYQTYVSWADRQRGEEPLSQRSLSASLEERGILKDRKGPKGRTRYLGIGLEGVEEADLKGLKDVEGCFGNSPHEAVHG